MSGSRARINIYVPNVCRFPELAVVGGYRRPEQMTMLGPLGSDKTEASAVAEVAAAALEEENGVEGSGRSLYIVNGKGDLLEHVRYQGSDYRSALRAAINATPNHWQDSRPLDE